MVHPKQIPLTPQTDPQRFPQWREDAPFGQSGARYPKVLTRPYTEEDREAWVAANRRIDKINGEYWDSRPQPVGSPTEILATKAIVLAGHAKHVGEVILVHDEKEEEEVLELLGNPTLWDARVADAETRALKDEIEMLRDQLKAKAHNNARETGEEAKDLALYKGKSPVEAERARMKAENDALEAEIERMEALARRKDALSGDKPKKRGRPKKVKTVTLDEIEAAE